MQVITVYKLTSVFSWYLWNWWLRKIP